VQNWYGTPQRDLQYSNAFQTRPEELKATGKTMQEKVFTTAFKRMTWQALPRIEKYMLTPWIWHGNCLITNLIRGQKTPTG